MSGAPVTCSKCHAPLPSSQFNRGTLFACPACEVSLQVYVFPARFQRAAQPATGETILLEGEASCFYHPEKRAAVPCGQCGRFLCSLCDVEMNGQHFCPGCLQAGQAKGALPQLETSRALYDSGALTLSLLPVLVWPVTLITGPLSVAVAVYSFKKPTSVIPRTRIRAWLAILFGTVQTVLWMWLAVAMFRDHS